VIGAGKKSNCQAAAAERERVAAAAAAGVAISGGVLSHQPVRVRGERSGVRPRGGEGRGPGWRGSQQSNGGTTGRGTAEASSPPRDRRERHAECVFSFSGECFFVSGETTSQLYALLL